MQTEQREQDMDATDLTKVDRAILDALQDGRDADDQPWGRLTKGALKDETGFSRNSIYNRIEVLEAAGCVTTYHDGTRLFEFVADPREDEDV